MPKKCVDEHGRFWTMDDDRGPRLSDSGVLKICGNDRRLGSLETLKMFDSLDLLEIKNQNFSDSSFGHGSLANVENL